MSLILVIEWWPESNLLIFSFLIAVFNLLLFLIISAHAYPILVKILFVTLYEIFSSFEIIFEAPLKLVILLRGFNQLTSFSYLNLCSVHFLFFVWKIIFVILSIPPTWSYFNEGSRKHSSLSHAKVPFIFLLNVKNKNIN